MCKREPVQHEWLFYVFKEDWKTSRSSDMGTIELLMHGYVVNKSELR